MSNPELITVNEEQFQAIRTEGSIHALELLLQAIDDYPDVESIKALITCVLMEMGAHDG